MDHNKWKVCTQMQGYAKKEVKVIIEMNDKESRAIRDRLAASIDLDDSENDILSKLYNALWEGEVEAKGQ